MGKEKAEGVKCNDHGTMNRPMAGTKCSFGAARTAFSSALYTCSDGHFCGEFHKPFEQWTGHHFVINLSMLSVWLSSEGFFFVLFLNGSLLFSDVVFCVFEDTKNRLLR